MNKLKVGGLGAALALTLTPIGIIGATAHSAQAATGGGCTGFTDVGNGIQIRSCIQKTAGVNTAGTKARFTKTIVNATCQFNVNLVRSGGGVVKHDTKDCTAQMTLNTDVTGQTLTTSCSPRASFYTEAWVVWHTVLPPLADQPTRHVKSPTLFC